MVSMADNHILCFRVGIITDAQHYTQNVKRKEESEEQDSSSSHF